MFSTAATILHPKEKYCLAVHLISFFVTHYITHNFYYL